MMLYQTNCEVTFLESDPRGEPLLWSSYTAPTGAVVLDLGDRFAYTKAGASTYCKVLYDGRVCWFVKYSLREIEDAVPCQ